MKVALLLTAVLVLPIAAQAQSQDQIQDFGLAGPPVIETQTLDAAQDFDAGILKDGALDTNLWQGTSAARAAQLLADAPLKDTDPIIRNIVRTVILSGGVPPQAKTGQDAQAYESARLQAVLAIESGRSGDTATLDGFLARNPELARAPLAQVDLALSKGNWQRACEISDTVTTERAKPAWARLRATCHALRGEMSAADVTRDFLRSSGYDNPAYHAQMDALLAGRGPAPETDQTDALVTFLSGRVSKEKIVAAPPAPGRDADLMSLFRNFDVIDLATLETTLGNISFDATLPDLDLETALSTSEPRATARLFILGRAGNAAAMDAFITRAIAAGVQEDTALNRLAPLIQTLPAKGRVNTNLMRYTRAAILNRDIESLQLIYAALPEGPLQARVALIADALGGGFAGQGLGRDIEGRLSAPTLRAQAVTDAQIALALGASLSDIAAEGLEDAPLSKLTLPQNQLLMLDAAVRANSRAEISLRVATLLARPDLTVTDKARITSALTQAGLPQFAGQIAAHVFFEGLKPTS
ncbi:hypothetical protein GCM10011309_17100 [Litorimonas cladophorae]|uniref:Uncharacterized protein n=1 Tax=Litorimonas cladophorae TaxID=1220491 RepID=A0A918KLJ7_9PROT|nr:hypothetical protein [Litorimonas cladophorae]GGX67972.1 hypothetical protein GCM10011309_17100 [Litorimonas cladophorae]